MREIKNNIYEINKYIIYKIFLFNKKNKNEYNIIIKITLREIYPVNKLVVDILLKNNILILKRLISYYHKRTIHT